MRVKTVALCAVSAAALVFLAPVALGDISTDYWVESHAASQGLMRGDRWDGTYEAGDYPAFSQWEGVSAGTGEFGTNRTASFSALSEDVHFAYAYADATWSDTVTIYNPSAPLGDALEVYLHFNLSGSLAITETGTPPADTRIEGRAAVSADVKSVDLSLAAHGYNMLTDYGDGSVIMRKSGDWELGGTPVTPLEYSYGGDIVLPAVIPNGVPFDLLAKVAVATHAQIAYTGEGEFGGLGGFGLSAEADFAHSMVLGVFTDAQGRVITDLGFLVGSAGPTFGGPIVIPEPGCVVLFLTGLAALGAAGRRLRA